MNRTLDTVPPGRTVLLARIDDALAPDFREQLAAYGFVPGRALDVLAQQPMTVVVRYRLRTAMNPKYRIFMNPVGSTCCKKL